jgi:hypothetical protein
VHTASILEFVLRSEQRSSAATAHATKRTISTARDRATCRKSRSAPLATANGYRPADGWGVVIQAWQPGNSGTPSNLK